jgi:hypothetical protein
MFFLLQFADGRAVELERRSEARVRVETESVGRRKGRAGGMVEIK